MTVGVVRLSASGGPIGEVGVHSLFPAFGESAFPFVCASPNGKVAIVYTVLQDALSSYATKSFGTNATYADLTSEIAEGASVVAASLSNSGALVDYALVQSGPGKILGTSCGVDDAGAVVVAGLTEGTTIEAQNSLAGASLTGAFTFSGNETLGWLATFNAVMAPIAIGATGTSGSGNKG